jgi:hypothetical protein
MMRRSPSLVIPPPYQQRGDVPGWVLIVLMTSALVVAIWGVASDRLVDIVRSALDTVCGTVGC